MKDIILGIIGDKRGYYVGEKYWLKHQNSIYNDILQYALDNDIKYNSFVNYYIL